MNPNTPLSPEEPIPPFPLPPEKEDERIPVPPGVVVPEPLNLPSDDEPKPPIEEDPKEPKIYL
jgi:hypothetical protein